MRASFSLIPMPESRSRTMVYAFQGAPRHSWESHNVILIPMGDFAAGLFDYFYEVNLIGFHFSPVPNCSERKPFIWSLYLNYCWFLLYRIIKFLV